MADRFYRFKIVLTNGSVYFVEGCAEETYDPSGRWVRLESAKGECLIFSAYAVSLIERLP